MNALNKDLTGKVVRLRFRDGKEAAMLVEDGFGASPFTANRGLYGVWVRDGQVTCEPTGKVDAMLVTEIVEIIENIEPRSLP